MVGMTAFSGACGALAVEMSLGLYAAPVAMGTSGGLRGGIFSKSS